MRRLKRIGAAIAGTFWTWRAMRRGWMIDGEDWFVRPHRYNDRPPSDFADSVNAFVGDETDVNVFVNDAAMALDPDAPDFLEQLKALGIEVPAGKYLFCRSGRQAIELDTGGMV